MKLALHRLLFLLGGLGTAFIFVWILLIDNIQNKRWHNSRGISDTFQNCVVHVSGLHHSGTGLVYQLLQNALGKGMCSTLQGMNVPENEGQHFQTVYPPFRERNRYLCSRKDGTAPGFANVYYCPSMLDQVNNDSKMKLWSEWSSHWDLSKPYLLQKTPTMDVIYLERMSTHPSFHVLVMRHPFAWHWPKNRSPQKTLGGWIDSWAHVLWNLREGNVDNFAVVQYESMVQQPEETAKAISDLLKSSCAASERAVHTGKSLLELRGTAISTDYMWPSRVANVRKFCLQLKDCSRLIRLASRVLLQLHYDLHDWREFPKAGTISRVLFSHHERPDKTIVDELLHLVEELNGFGW